MEIQNEFIKNLPTANSRFVIIVDDVKKRILRIIDIL